MAAKRQGCIVRITKLSDLESNVVGFHHLHLVLRAAGPASIDSDSSAALLACQSLLRLYHVRVKAFTAAPTSAATGQVLPQRQAAADRIRIWEQQLLEQVIRTLAAY